MKKKLRNILVKYTSECNEKFLLILLQIFRIYFSLRPAKFLEEKKLYETHNFHLFQYSNKHSSIKAQKIDNF